MPPEPFVDDEDYASSEDSDFSPDAVPNDHVSSADSDEEGPSQAPKAATKQDASPTKRKRGDVDPNGSEAEDAGFENSGDEAIIGKGKKRRRRDRDGPAGGSDGEEGGGQGGFVKTRSQRAQEKAERRATAVQGPVTVDVDALWAQMTAGPAQAEAQQPQELASLATAAVAAVAATTSGHDGENSAASAEPATESDTITIRRTYNFAGQVHTEEKRVARDSAEAKLYLASLDGKDAEGGDSSEAEEKAKRLPRKAFRSAFEPVLLLDGLAGAGTIGAGVLPRRRADLDLGLQARLQAREQRAAQERAKKLNTVEKSRMDWAGYVDKAGIQDELALAGKAKGSFAERQQFLARSEARREDEARRARLAGKV